jgi:tetratricopeptide (TPR) repeat protein
MKLGHIFESHPEITSHKMKLDALTELYDRIYGDESTKDPRTFISLIEEDSNIIELTGDESRDYYYKATRLTSDYGMMLMKIGYYSKALSYINKSIKLIENDEVLKGTDLLEDPMYEALILHRGATLYYLKNKKSSRIDFKKLVDKFPDNELYNGWYKTSMKSKLSIIEWIFAVIATICLVFSLILEPEDGIADRIAFFGLIGGFVGGLTAYIIRFRINKS